MKKLLLTMAIVAIYNASSAFTMQIIKTNGDNSGYYRDVQMYNNALLDAHQLFCTDPGIKRCSASDWNLSSCVSSTEVDACMSYVDGQIAAGNNSGSFTTSTGIAITWSSTSTGNVVIDISKDCD